MPRKDIDWAAIEAAYRSGTFSNRQIAHAHDCAESAIRARASRYGWTKDLSAAVRAATNAKLVRADVRSPNAQDDAAIIDSAADFRAALVTSHRRDLAQMHGLKRVLAERLSTILAGGEPDGLCLGLKESPGDLLEKLSRVTARLIPLERQAHNLDEQADPNGEGAGGVAIYALPDNGR